MPWPGNFLLTRNKPDFDRPGLYSYDNFIPASDEEGDKEEALFQSSRYCPFINCLLASFRLPRRQIDHDRQQFVSLINLPANGA
jgi:hypothetical protein